MYCRMIGFFFMQLFLQQSQYQNRYLVLLYHRYHQMIKHDFDFSYQFEVLNTSNQSDDVDFQKTIAGNIDNGFSKMHYIERKNWEGNFIDRIK